MNGDACEKTRLQLADWVAGRGPENDGALRGHLEGCPECRAEAELTRHLFLTRPEPPEGLTASITLAARRDRSRRRARPWWGLAAAAVAALALGIGIWSPQPPAEGGELPAYVAESPTGAVWVSGDGEVAGMASLDGLSDEALMTLLEELGSGGAA